MVKVENLKAVDGGKKVEVEYLGCLLWTTVSNSLKVPTDELDVLIKSLGLERFASGRTNPRDAFRRVTKKAQRWKISHGTSTYLNLLVREVNIDNEKIVRQMVREIVDKENTQLQYLPIVQLEIEKDNMVTIPFVSDLLDIEKEVLQDLQKNFDSALHIREGSHIGNLMKRILSSCSPVSVRPSGGVYFIPQAHIDTVETLKTFLRGLVEISNNYFQTNDHSRIWSVPVIDAAEHREMVEESLEEQVINGSVSLINEMKKRTEDSSKGISPKIAQRYIDQIKNISNGVKEYEEMLEIQATKARENLELAKVQAMKLLEIATEEG